MRLGYGQISFELKNVKEEISMSFTMKKVISLFLCAMILLPTLIACGQQPSSPSDINNQSGAPGDTNNTAVTEQETKDLVQDALDQVLSDVDWEGNDFGILYVDDIGGYKEEVEATPDSNDSSSSAVINDAVYERNALFEEYCHLNFVKIPTTSAMAGTNLKTEVMTGTGDFHLVSQTTSGTADSALSGYLYNYLNLDIDYEKPWWDVASAYRQRGYNPERSGQILPP